MPTLTAKPKGNEKPSFDDLSPDLQWAICQRRERGQRAIQLGAIALVGLLAAPMVIPGLNQQMDISLHEGRDIKLGPLTLYEVPPALEAVGIMPPEALQTIDEGDTIGGYTVNSGYGDRVHPIHGDVRFHNGVDLPTETGVPIFAPGARSSRVKVDCLNQPGGAGLYAEISSPDIPGLLFQAMHLSECATGLHAGGSVIAKTGGDPDLEPHKAGGSTGPHLHWSQLDSATMAPQKPQKGYLQWAITGQSPKTLKEIDQAAVPFQSLLSDEILKCAIGNAEGTKNDDCSPNPAYFGHIDPGNGAANLGAFSYQHGASSPEEADAKQLERLRKAEADLQQQAVDKFGQPLSKAALASALDLWNQAPLAGDDFVMRLSTADPSPQEIIEARSQAFIGPDGLDAPGLGNSMDNVEADQRRRTEEALSTLDYLKRQESQ